MAAINVKPSPHLLSAIARPAPAAQPQQQGSPNRFMPNYQPQQQMAPQQALNAANAGATQMGGMQQMQAPQMQQPMSFQQWQQTQQQAPQPQQPMVVPYRR